MNNARLIPRVATGLALTVAVTASALAQVPLKNHTFDVPGPNPTVCTDGVVFQGTTTAAGSVGPLITSEVWDAAGTTLLATGNSHTFTAVPESFTFTVPGAFTLGATVTLVATTSPGSSAPLGGTNGDVATATVANCSIMVPTLPGWGLGLLLAILLTLGFLFMRRAAPLQSWGRSAFLAVLLPISLAIAAAPAAAEFTLPTFVKVFSPDTIGPDSTSMLTFTIDNSASGSPVSDVAFTDTLPAGVTLAAPAFVSNTCEGMVSAPNGGTTASLTDGKVAAGATCKVVINVVGSTPGTHMNVSGDLTSSAGNSGTAADDLDVTTSLPGFSKSFAPSAVELGGKSTLTLLINNMANGSPVPNLDFTDVLPPGMVIAGPANASTTCGTAVIPPTLTAPPGGSTITLDSNGVASFPAVGDESTCSVTVDVVGGAIGMLGNVSGNLQAEFVDAGKASAVLEVTGFETLLQILKDFKDDPVAPGGTVTLEFEITNKSRDFPATGISFDDTIDPMGALIGVTATLPPTPDPPCGAGSALSSAGGVLSLTGGSLAAEETCKFSVELTVPAGATPGSYANTTTAVMGTIDGNPETGNIAGDILSVVSFPLLTKAITPDPVGTGSMMTLTFTLKNPETMSAMSDVTFFDELTDGGPGTGFLPFPVSVTLPPMPNPPCGAGSSLTFAFFDTDRQRLVLDGGSLEANDGLPGGPDECTFSVMVEIPAGLAPGTYTNTTEEPSATLDSFPGPPTVTGKPAKDDIVVVAAPQLTKEFTDDPALPGGSVTLVFTLENLDPDNAASAIAFSDDLGAVLSGLTVTSVDVDGCGGTPSGIATAMFGYTGGTLAGGATCSIELTLSVPDVPGGTFTNTTSEVTAMVLGVAATSPEASDDLVVAGLQFSKVFSGDPVIPGGTATLTFTIDNTAGSSPDDDATDITFADDLNADLPGLAATTIPLSPLPGCGASSTLTPFSGGTFLVFSGGAVAGGAVCTFSVTVTVPATIPNPSPPPSDIPTPDDFYANTTSSLFATIDSTSATLPPATDVIEVNSTLLQIAKEFTDDPVAPGGTVTAKFTLTNLSATETVTDIAFSDDFGAALSGLMATGAMNMGCGGMSTTIFPSATFDFGGGTLMPGASCMITVTVDVPMAPLADSPPFINTTSGVTGKVGTLDVFGDPDSDELLVQLLAIKKAFTDDPTAATRTVTLEFTLTNLGTTAVSDLAFTDDLSKVIAGLTATTLPPVGICGAGSQLTGTSFLAFTGGSLGAGASCVIPVTLTVPASASKGLFLNKTSDLREAGIPVAPPATDLLEVEPPPTFAKVFSPNPAGQGFDTTLTFTIDNTANTLTATDLAFLDMLPFDLKVAPSPMVTNTCGGAVVAAAGSTTISLSGGTVGAGATCKVSVRVRSSTVGPHTNTSGDLTSSSGNSGKASNMLTVIGCAAPDGANATLTNEVVLGTKTVTACNTIEVKEHVQVLGPSGNLTLKAGVAVIVFNGVEFGTGSVVTIDIDPSLIP